MHKLEIAGILWTFSLPAPGFEWGSFSPHFPKRGSSYDNLAEKYEILSPLLILLLSSSLFPSTKYSLFLGSNATFSA